MRQPSHWDIAFIPRFMIFFGPLSSVYDFVTFGLMLWVFHAGAAEFRSGWFVESLGTQTLVIFAIRTRRIPFFRSHPSLPLILAAVSVVLVGAALPATPFARTLGFRPLPPAFFAALAAMVIGYFALIEVGKTIFYRTAPIPPAPIHQGPDPPPPRRPLQHQPPHQRSPRRHPGVPGTPTGANRPRNQVLTDPANQALAGRAVDHSHRVRGGRARQCGLRPDQCLPHEGGYLQPA